MSSLHRPLSILVVDPDVESAKGLAQLFTAAGHQTRYATSGTAFVEAAFAFDPSVVIVDVNMQMFDTATAAHLFGDQSAGRPYIIAMIDEKHGEADASSWSGVFDFVLKKPPDILSLLQSSSDAPNSWAPSI